MGAQRRPPPRLWRRCGTTTQRRPIADHACNGDQVPPHLTPCMIRFARSPDFFPPFQREKGDVARGPAPPAHLTEEKEDLTVPPVPDVPRRGRRSYDRRYHPGAVSFTSTRRAPASRNPSSEKTEGGEGRERGAPQASRPGRPAGVPPAARAPACNARGGRRGAPVREEGRRECPARGLKVPAPTLVIRAGDCGPAYEPLPFSV